MINHGRTLLLNRDGNTRPEPTFFLEEYVDPEYRAVELTTSLKTVYQILIGEGADDAFANFRVWTYMSILDSTEFRSLLTALDSRITYRNNKTLIDTPVTREVVAANAAATGVDGFLQGRVDVSQACPRLIYNWELKEVSPTKILVTDLKSRKAVTEDITFTEGLSSAIPMVGQQGVFVKLQTSSLLANATWNANLQAQPPQDLAGVLEPLGQISGETARGLFGDGIVEPYKTLKELWEKHNYFHYRLSAILLAHILRVEELRVSGRG